MVVAKTIILQCIFTQQKVQEKNGCSMVAKKLFTIVLIILDGPERAGVQVRGTFRRGISVLHSGAAGRGAVLHGGLNSSD
jgi:hypothetical protein